MKKQKSVKLYVQGFLVSASVGIVMFSLLACGVLNKNLALSNQTEAKKDEVLISSNVMEYEEVIEESLSREMKEFEGFESVDEVGLEFVNNDMLTDITSNSSDVIAMGSSSSSSPRKKSRRKEVSKTVKTWKRSTLSPNTTKLSVGENDSLPLESMQVAVQIDGFRARVVLDCYYRNTRGNQLEGKFQLRLPEGGTPYFLAFGESITTRRFSRKGGTIDEDVDDISLQDLSPEGLMASRRDTWKNVKDARMVTRARAAHAYRQETAKRIDPALMEWSGAGVFNAKVFPLMANKLHRIVVGYDMPLSSLGKDLAFTLDLPDAEQECTVDMIVKGLNDVAVETSPVVDDDGTLREHRYWFTDMAGKTIFVRQKNPGVIALRGSDAGGEFFAVRGEPNVKTINDGTQVREAVFLLDTSYSNQPERFQIHVDLISSILNNNRDTIHSFNVLLFDVETRWWKTRLTKNTPENIETWKKYANEIVLEGATDLTVALKTGCQNADSVFLLSDGAATWGDIEWERMAEVIGSTRVFAYRTGFACTDVATLERIAQFSGGGVFSVVSKSDVLSASRAYHHRPWVLKNIATGEGGDIQTAGNLRSLRPETAVTLVGRGVPSNCVIFKGENETIEMPIAHTINSTLAPRAYGEIAVGSLEEWKDSTKDIAKSYAVHFRVAAKTCSLLMLENEAAYERYNIKPEEDALVVSQTSIENILAEKIADARKILSSQKEAFFAMLKRLKEMPGMSFNTSTAFELAVKAIDEKSFCLPDENLKRKDYSMSRAYRKNLKARKLQYDGVVKEAHRRVSKNDNAGAVKAVSSMIEDAPGDYTRLRDVAMFVRSFGYDGAAAKLLLRVAHSRPYEPQTYLALAETYEASGRYEVALLWYEVVLSGQWDNRFGELQRIAKVECLRLLRGIERRGLKMSEYAKAKLKTYEKQLGMPGTDLVVIMYWNTDRTDVDMHVKEPSGETCFYSNRRTKLGGAITRDVTQGFGPEMYTIRKAKNGAYRIRAKYYSTDTRKTSLNTTVFATVIQNWGKANEIVKRHAVVLKKGKQMHDIARVVIK